MKFSPIDWKWSYKDNRLIVCLKDDIGKNYIFNTYYQYNSLTNPPEIAQDFCIEDAQLLNAFQEGLADINLNEGSCLELGLNAVACTRFVGNSAPVSRYFIPHDNTIYFKLGDVVSLYAPDGSICDCIVLNEVDSDYKTTLMIVNQYFKAIDNKVFYLGTKLRVDPRIICKFRSFRKNVRYA